jgi:hypothetical protein
MRKWLPLAIGAVVVVIVALWVRSRTGASADEATLAERLRTADSALAVAQRQAARTDTQYVIDTAAMRDAAARFARRAARVDTQWLHDTIPVPVEVVREIVATADTTIRACRAALTTCEQRVADRDTVIARERRLRATGDSLSAILLRRARPRLLPFVEGGVDPLHDFGLVARGGAELRLFGAVRLVGALDYSTAPETRTRALAGVRVTF